MEIDIAKATFIQTEDFWKVYWVRSDLKWHRYDPKPTVKTLAAFVKLVEEDKHHAFWR